MRHHPSHPESGNIIFFILLAIVLIGLVTAALRSSGIESANIDREDLTIKVAQLRQNAVELQHAVNLVMQNGISEADISFADRNPAASAYGTYDDNPPAEIFNPKGGGAIWRSPPAGVNDGSAWVFYGSTRIPGVGTDRADLVAVLPNVTREFCDAINKINEQPVATPPADSGTCLHGGSVFTPSGGYGDSGGNTMDETTFRQGPASAAPAGQACVACGSAYHFYHVLLGR